MEAATQTHIIDFINKAGHRVRLEFSTVRGTVNVTVNLADGSGGTTCIANRHFADIISALWASYDPRPHIEELPDYCECPTCSDNRAKRLADLIVKSRIESAKRLMKEHQEDPAGV